MKMRVKVYVDGMNLYYGSLKSGSGAQYKWLAHFVNRMHTELMAVSMQKGGLTLWSSQTNRCHRKSFS